MRFIVLGAGAIGGVVGAFARRASARAPGPPGWLAPEEVLERLR
ncbi:MAG: hypothetical protein WBP81_34440 [Solirubrobacteraceae bacterium]